MADNHNSCLEAAAAVGISKRLAITRWTSKSFLAPSALVTLVNVLVYELLFIFGDTLLDKVALSCAIYSQDSIWPLQLEGNEGHVQSISISFS